MPVADVGAHVAREYASTCCVIHTRVLVVHTWQVRFVRVCDLLQRGPAVCRGHSRQTVFIEMGVIGSTGAAVAAACCTRSAKKRVACRWFSDRVGSHDRRCPRDRSRNLRGELRQESIAHRARQSRTHAVIRREQSQRQPSDICVRRTINRGRSRPRIVDGISDAHGLCMYAPPLALLAAAQVCTQPASPTRARSAERGSRSRASHQLRAHRACRHR